jgi:MYXO-CTERM domain-containing protein
MRYYNLDGGKLMLRKLFFAVAGVLAMASVTQAASTIIMGNHNMLLPNTPGQVVNVMVVSTGGDLEENRPGGMDFSFLVGGGGPEIGDLGLAPGVDGPHITGIDVSSAGTLFGTVANSGATITDFGVPVPQVINGSITTSGTGTSALVPSSPIILARVTIDTTGFNAGSWSFVGDYPDLPTSLNRQTGPLPLTVQNGQISIMAPPPDNVPGDSPENPILPNGTLPGGGFVFNESPSDPDGPWNDRTENGGAWFDPPPADGYYYESTGGTLFVKVGLPGLGVVPDNNGTYTVRQGSDGMTFTVAAGSIFTFTTPQTYFVVGDIIAPVDGADPLAFPTLLQFSGLVNSFKMIPLPEPSTFVLAAIGLVGLVGYGARRRRS